MSVITEYLQDVPEPKRAALEHTRQIIERTAPTARPVITYGMPGYKYEGKYLIALAAFKDHVSIFPGAHAIEVYAKDLADFKTSKGTVQFTPEHPLPDDIVAGIVRQRMADIDGERS